MSTLDAPASTLETRRAQMFPRLDPPEIKRLARFGEVRRYADGERLFSAGKAAVGMFIVLSGSVRVSETNERGEREHIVDQGPGEFLAEVGQLAGRPSLVDGDAVGDVEALLITPANLRLLMVREAELGEEIMRALILRRVSLMETGGGGTVIVGPGDDVDVVRLTGFLTRNVHPYTLLDSRTDQAAADVIARFQLQPDQLPAVICPGGKNLKNPTETELATCLGLLRPLDPTVIHDAVIVGAGPAGLATAVYAASEGLKVLMIDQRAHGGQAGASARIENYFGFPTGITGHALVSRAYNQAQKFGVESAIPAQVTEMEDADPASGARFRLTLADGQTVLSQSVVIASGVRYRKPAWKTLPDYEGSSAHFWASPIEARLCAGQEVVLVGAGNSAGQAVVYLSRHASKVWMLCRSGGLAESMSQYLVDRIEALDNVEILARTQIVELEGEHGVLQALSWQTEGQAPERHEIRHVFIFTGAEPNTDWLEKCRVMLDPKGFVVTGRGVNATTLPLETSINGVFAIGDVRSGSTKRVASAVGEGAQVVATLHRFLADPDALPAPV